MSVEEIQARQEQAITNFKEMYGEKKVKVWARLGTTLWLDPVLAKKDFKQAVINALTEGNAQLDGDTYFPEYDENEESGLELKDLDFYNRIKVDFLGKGSY